MIGWLIILGVSVALSVVGLLLIGNYKTEDAGGVCLVLGLIMIVSCAVVIPAASLDAQRFMNEFNQQAMYLESHTVQSGVENAALTNKKIELNSSLYNAKWAKGKFGIFSFYPNSVNDLEPIQ